LALQPKNKKTIGHSDAQMNGQSRLGNQPTVKDGVEVKPNWFESAQTTQDFEVDQRVSW
jgi:hypothetical protein